MTIQSRYERLYRKVPSSDEGYELNPDHGLFSVIIPEATTNLVKNPSVEYGTTAGYAAFGGAMAGTYDWQAFGAAGLKLTPAVSTESGFYFGSAGYEVTLGIGLTYTASVVIQGEEGKVYYIWFATTAGALIGNKRAWIGTGHKQRIWVTHTETAGADRRVYVSRDARYTDQNLFYADGLQVEAKAYPTTYCDGSIKSFVIGETPYQWTGTPNLSTSTRSAQTRTGGREVNLLDLGLRIIAIVGLGMAPLVDQSLPIPGLGEMFQGTGTMARTFNLIGDIFYDTPRQGQAMRDDLINAFKPDRVASDQPLILRYQACDDEGDPTGDSLDIVCTYLTGLEGSINNNHRERLNLTFKMHLPLILSTYDSGIELGFQTSVANANSILKRGTDGIWSALNLGIIVAGADVRDIAEGNDGTIFVGGDFLNLTDANGDYITKWNGTAFSSLGTGASSGLVFALVIGPDGSLYAGGQFSSMGGVANTARIAKWDGSTWTALGTGSDDGIVYALAFDGAGNLYAGGSFTGMGGVANTSRIAKWDGSVWTPLGTGAADNIVYCITTDSVNNVFVGGTFTLMGGVANTLRIAKWSVGAWYAIGTGADDTVRAIVFDKTTGLLYAGGAFHTMSGTTFSHIAKFNGTIWSDMKGGVNNVVYSLNLHDNLLYAGGVFTIAGGINLTDRLAVWNGSVWLSLDVDLPGVPNVYKVMTARDGTLYVGYNSPGNAISATITVQNIGSSLAYPTVIFVGPGTVWQFKNYTTGKAIYFDDLTLLNGDLAVLSLDPLDMYFISGFLGDIWNKILPGSDLDLALMSGDNNVSTYMFGSTGGATKIFMFWRQAYWSLDGAVIK